MKGGKITFFIPNDIIYLIFLHLPVKALLKFKCVSKEWNSMIADRKFVISYLVKSGTRSEKGLNLIKLRIESRKTDGAPVLFVVHSDGKSESTGIELDKCRWLFEFEKVSKLPFNVEFAWRHCKQKVLGLICFGDIILNPSTKEAIKLPDHEDCWDYIPERFRTLDNHVICYSLGFDSASDRFKAIILFSDLKKEEVKDNRILARVLTLGIDSSWRKVNMNISISSELTQRYGGFPYIRIHTSVFAGNKIFFLISGDRLLVKPSLLAFDLHDEKFRLLRWPWECKKNLSHFVFDMRGNVICRRMKKNGMLVWDVWGLEDYENEVWIKKNDSSNNKSNINVKDGLKRDDFLIFDNCETILSLKQITTDHQQIWRWGCK